MLAPDRLHTLVVFALLTVAAMAWSVRCLGEATNLRRKLRAAGAMLAVILLAVVTVGLQMNRTLGYVGSWGEVPGLFKPAGVSGPVEVVRRETPKPTGEDPVIPAHEGDPAWDAAFAKERHGARTVTFKGPHSGLSLPVWVVLPPGYAPQNGKTYRVVVMLHGYPGNPAKVPSQLRLAEALRKHPDTIFAIPSLQADPNSPDCVDVKGRPAVATWVTQDVVGLIRHNFANTAPTRKGWTIAGASYGGHCASVLGLTTPQTFQNIIAFSGYDEPETGRLLGASTILRRQYTVSHLFEKQNEWAQNYYVTGTERDRKSKSFIKKLKSASSDNIKLTTRIEKDGGHNWKVWKKELSAALAWNGRH